VTEVYEDEVAPAGLGASGPLQLVEIPQRDDVSGDRHDPRPVGLRIGAVDVLAANDVKVGAGVIAADRYRRRHEVEVLSAQPECLPEAKPAEVEKGDERAFSVVLAYSEQGHELLRAGGVGPVPVLLSQLMPGLRDESQPAALGAQVCGPVPVIGDLKEGR
jgi:hypothetical protein